jgi:hypothetical protein
MSGSRRNIEVGWRSMRIRSTPDRIRKRTNNAKALEAWDNEGGTTPRSPRNDSDKRTARTEKECLGAAVIMQWNDLTTDTQRELFGAAVSMSEPRTKIERKQRIARFLHTHKDDLPR